MPTALDTLLLPLLEGDLSLPERAKGFFLQADPQIAARLPDLKDRLVCEQPGRSAWAALTAQGWAAEPALPVGPYQFGLCLLTKHKAENLANLARGLRLLTPGAPFLFAGANDIGADSLARIFAGQAGPLRQRSKNHAKAFWLIRGDAVPPMVQEWEAAGRPAPVPAIGGQSQPGLYHWDRVDSGSALLADHFPPELAGRVADLGAGWGYLGMRLLKGGFAVDALDLFESDARALAAATANLAAAPWPVRGHWHDLRDGLTPAQFDWIVANPPFHEGKAADPGLGQAFIRAAARGLVPGGHFLMVANRHLPYEAVLRECFATARPVIEKDGYKVLIAQLGRT